MSFKSILSICTAIFLVILLYFSRHEIVHAWELLGRVNIWILLLIIPVQLIVYYADAETIYVYLKAKQKVEFIPKTTLTRIAVELNFVNHIMPSGGVSGLSYTSWRLKKYGVSAGRATMAQIIRYAMTGVALVLLIPISVIIITIDGNISRWMILMSSGLVAALFIAVLVGYYLMTSQARMAKFSKWLVNSVNLIVYKITFGHKKSVLNRKVVDDFFDEMHKDFLILKEDKKVLFWPLIWSLVFTIADIGLFMVTFWALGHPINPAPLVIAYGVANTVGMLVVTPGGTGAYEAIMVAFLAIAGLSQGVVIAGIVLTRVILLLGTIVFGYICYQTTIMKHGKSSDDGQS